MNRNEIISFLKDYRAGKRNIAELMPVHEVDFVSIEGEEFVTNRETGQRYSREEFQELERNTPTNQIFLLLCWSKYFPAPPLPCSKETYLKYIDQCFPASESEIDLTPYSYQQ